MVQIEPLVRSLTLTLPLYPTQALSISVTIVVKTVNVNDAFVVVALAVRHVQDAIAHTLLKRRLTVIRSIVILVQLSSFLARSSRLVDLLERYS